MPTQPLDIRQGRRFACTRCGNCCRKDGFVYMSDAEFRRVADALALPRSGVMERYGVYFDGDSGAWILEAKNGAGCPLLSASGHCRVHVVKPIQCGSWPFWPEMIDDARAWEAAKSFCPGLDAEQGTLYAEPDIRAMLAERRATEERDIEPRG